MVDEELFLMRRAREQAERLVMPLIRSEALALARRGVEEVRRLHPESAVAAALGRAQAAAVEATRNLGEVERPAPVMGPVRAVAAEAALQVERVAVPAAAGVGGGASAVTEYAGALADLAETARRQTVPALAVVEDALAGVTAAAAVAAAKTQADVRGAAQNAMAVNLASGAAAAVRGWTYDPQRQGGKNDPLGARVGGRGRALEVLEGDPVAYSNKLREYAQWAREENAGPSFDMGGYVNAPRNTPVRATVHGGERVLTADQNDQMLKLLAGILAATQGGRTLSVDGRELGAAASGGAYRDGINLARSGAITSGA